jgi:hypothetical protein
MLPLLWVLRAAVTRRRLFLERFICAAGTSRDHDGALPPPTVPLRSTKRNLTVTMLEVTSSVKPDALPHPSRFCAFDPAIEPVIHEQTRVRD